MTISLALNIADRPPLTFTFTPGERQLFKRREKLTVSEWSAKYRIVTNGPMTGKWRNEVTPYLIEPMDTWQLPWIREVYLCFAPQTGKTQVAFNCMCFAIDQRPGGMMYIMPDEKVTKRISKRRIGPMFKGTPRIAALMSPRADDTTALSVQFTNGADLMMAWATSPAVLASESVLYVFGDELDKYPEFSGKESDPVSLARVRMLAYPHTSKFLGVSTPTTENGYIVKAMEEADEIRDYQVPCPICGEYQVMVFDGIIWPGNCRDPQEIQRRRLANYQCSRCGMFWDDHWRDEAVRKGRWVPRNEPVDRPISVAFHLPSWYSPFVSLSRIAADFLRGQNNPTKLMAFVTQHKAEAWKQVLISKNEEQVMAARCDLPPQTVPEEAVALTCGVDRQKNGFWFVVRAWTAALTSWNIHYGFLATWDDVERLIFDSTYPVANKDQSMQIFRAILDTGGGKAFEDMSMTEEAYFWLIKNRGRGGVALWGGKGSSAPLPRMLNIGNEILSTPGGKKLPDGLRLVIVDTNKSKDQFHYRLQLAAGQVTRDLPGAAFLHSGADADYAAQILAEEKQVDRRGHEIWVNAHHRPNHLLDAECLAAACVEMEFPGGGLRLLAEYAQKAKENQDSDRESSQSNHGTRNNEYRRW
jgi:phage terminase large subunit GpA-like protein